MKINGIVAVSDNGVIGKEFGLPWRLPNDLKWFKEHTVGKIVVMGRKTYETIGHPLPGRDNVVLSRTPTLSSKDAMFFTHLEEALAYSEHADEIFIIGGAQIYKEAEALIDCWYITKVHAEVEGDIHWTPDLTRFRMVFNEHHPADEKHEFPYSFKIYEQ